nr:MAG TPA: hypothetical protein [Caudoviricetes sp.]
MIITINLMEALILTFLIVEVSSIRNNKKDTLHNKIFGITYPALGILWGTILAFLLKGLN